MKKYIIHQADEYGNPSKHVVTEEVGKSYAEMTDRELIHYDIYLIEIMDEEGIYELRRVYLGRNVIV